MVFIQELFEPVEVFGKPAIFSNGKIDRNSIPSGYYAYDIRHDDSGDPASIEKFVGVNHYGTVILNRPVAMSQGDYRRCSSKDINFTADNEQTLRQYMNKNPPYRKDIER